MWQIWYYSPTLACLSPWYGLFWVTSTSVIQKKGDLMSGTSIHRWRPGKGCQVPHVLPHVLEVAQYDYTRRDATALGVIRTLSMIDCIFFIYLWLRHVISAARLMLLRTLARKLFRVITQQCASSSRNLQIDTPEQTYSSLMSKDPFFCSMLQQLHDDPQILF